MKIFRLEDLVSIESILSLSINKDVKNILVVSNSKISILKKENKGSSLKIICKEINLSIINNENYLNILSQIITQTEKTRLIEELDLEECKRIINSASVLYSLKKINPIEDFQKGYFDSAQSRKIQEILFADFFCNEIEQHLNRSEDCIKNYINFNNKSVAIIGSSFVDIIPIIANFSKDILMNANLYYYDSFSVGGLFSNPIPKREESEITETSKDKDFLQVVDVLTNYLKNKGLNVEFGFLSKTDFKHLDAEIQIKINHENSRFQILSDLADELVSDQKQNNKDREVYISKKQDTSIMFGNLINSSEINIPSFKFNNFILSCELLARLNLIIETLLCVNADWLENVWVLCKMFILSPNDDRLQELDKTIKRYINYSPYRSIELLSSENIKFDQICLDFIKIVYKKSIAQNNSSSILHPFPNVKKLFKSVFEVCELSCNKNEQSSEFSQIHNKKPNRMLFTDQEFLQIKSICSFFQKSNTKITSIQNAKKLIKDAIEFLLMGKTHNTNCEDSIILCDLYDPVAICSQELIFLELDEDMCSFFSSQGFDLSIFLNSKNKSNFVYLIKKFYERSNLDYLIFLLSNLKYLFLPAGLSPDSFRIQKLINYLEALSCSMISKKIIINHIDLKNDEDLDFNLNSEIKDGDSSANEAQQKLNISCNADSHKRNIVELFPKTISCSSLVKLINKPRSFFLEEVFGLKIEKDLSNSSVVLNDIESNDNIVFYNAICNLAKGIIEDYSDSEDSANIDKISIINTVVKDVGLTGIRRYELFEIFDELWAFLLDLLKKGYKIHVRKKLKTEVCFKDFKFNIECIPTMVCIKNDGALVVNYGASGNLKTYFEEEIEGKGLKMSIASICLLDGIDDSSEFQSINRLDDLIYLKFSKSDGRCALERFEISKNAKLTPYDLASRSKDQIIKVLEFYYNNGNDVFAKNIAHSPVVWNKRTNDIYEDLIFRNKT